MATMPHGMVLDIPASLHLDTWAGRKTYQIRVTGETRENFRFQALEDIPIKRSRWLKAGEHGRAPKDAVTVLNAKVTGSPKASPGGLLS